MSKGPEAQGTLSPRGRKPKRLEAQGARMKLYWYIRLLYSKMSERKKENRNRNIKLPKFLDSRRLNNTTSLISICWFLKCISYNLFDINNLFHGHCPMLRCFSMFKCSPKLKCSPILKFSPVHIVCPLPLIAFCSREGCSDTRPTHWHWIYLSFVSLSLLNCVTVSS